jgi:hypothetical protein
MTGDHPFGCMPFSRMQGSKRRASFFLSYSSIQGAAMSSDWSLNDSKILFSGAIKQRQFSPTIMHPVNPH